MKGKKGSNQSPDSAIEDKKTNKVVDFSITLDLDGIPKNVRLRWGQALPSIVYDNQTGIFYQFVRNYSYIEVSGQILSNIEVA